MRSTQYIIGFAALVCLVCGVVVAGSYESLKERQQINAQLDKKKKVLGVVSLYTAGEDITPEEIDKRFADNIQAKLVDLSTGQYADVTAEEIAAFDQRKARQDRPVASLQARTKRRWPECRIKPWCTSRWRTARSINSCCRSRARGFGPRSTASSRWSDTNTIAGITFYEHGETPGLGGEVENPNWQALWPGRKAFDGAWAPKINVKKGAAGLCV